MFLFRKRFLCTNFGIVPLDYEDLLSYYTHRGFRVIACATKHVDLRGWKQVERLTRQEAECELDFLGFIIFENKLKDATTDIIQELHAAQIREVMCTGDNILTAISVARECELIDRTAHCFIPHFEEGMSLYSDAVAILIMIRTTGHFQDPKARLKWQSVDNALFELDPDTLMVDIVLRRPNLQSY